MVPETMALRLHAMHRILFHRCGLLDLRDMHHPASGSTRKSTSAACAPPESVQGPTTTAPEGTPTPAPEGTPTPAPDVPQSHLYDDRGINPLTFLRRVMRDQNTPLRFRVGGTPGDGVAGGGSILQVHVAHRPPRHPGAGDIAG
jgi:hypothetical protein